MDDSDDYERALGRGRWYRQLTPPAVLGVVVALVPLGLHFAINGKDWVALGAGGLAMLLGLVTIVWGLVRSTSKALQIVVGLGIIAAGIFHVGVSGFAGSLLGPSEDDARARLRDDGFTDIEITERSDDGHGFSFEARRHGERCIGSIRIEGTNVSRFETCGLPEPLDEVIARCERGAANACADAAARLRGAETPDLARATQMSSRACELGDAGECFYVGVAHDRGDRGLPADPARALTMYERACDAGEGSGCVNAAITRLRGDGLDAADQTGGCRRARQGCELEHARACEILGECYRDAKGGVERDYVRARELFAGACEAEVGSGCINLASLHLFGDGGPEDRPRAYQLYQQGCALEVPTGCRMVARLQVEGVDSAVTPAAGRQRLDALCTGGDSVACLDLGMYLHEGEHLPQDRPGARVVFERGCEQRHAQCCWNTGVYHRDGLGDAARDPARSRAFFERACELGHADACRAAGRAG